MDKERGAMRALLQIKKILFLPVVTSCIVLANFNASYGAGKTEIPVPISMIYAGNPITERHLRGRIVPNSYLGQVSVYVRNEDIIGKIAKFNLAPARPIRTNQLMEPDIIVVNRPAILHYKAGVLRITAEVVPLNSAKVGEVVRVRNLQNNAIINGIAMADGSVSARLVR